MYRTKSLRITKIETDMCTTHCVQHINSCELVPGTVFISPNFMLINFGAVAPCGPWPPHCRGFYITH